MRELAEIALEAGSRERFREAALECVCRALSMDAGALNHTLDGRTIDVDSWGMSVKGLRPQLAAYMREVTPNEYDRALHGRAIDADNVFSRPRQDALRLYREYLVPSGVHGFCCRMWVNRHGCTWMTLSRAGRSARYTLHDLTAFDDLASVIAVGEALHASSTDSSSLFHGHGWERAERNARDSCRISGH